MRKTPIPKVPIFGDSTPYENPLAMVGYRTSLWSLVPVLGWPLGMIGMILGVIAYRRYHRNPDIEGQSQAAAAIYVGATSFIFQTAGLYCLARGLG